MVQDHFFPRLAFQILNLADNHVITPSIHSYPSQCGSSLSFMGKVGPLVAFSSLHSPSTIGVNWQWICWLPLIPISVSFITLWSNHYIQLLWGGMHSTICGSFRWVKPFPPPALVLLALCRCLAGHVASQCRLLLVAPYWMEAPWLPQFSVC